MSCRFTIWPSI